MYLSSGPNTRSNFGGGWIPKKCDKTVTEENPRKILQIPISYSQFYHYFNKIFENQLYIETLCQVGYARKVYLKGKSLIMYLNTLKENNDVL